jgi:hypothetical protein
MVAVHKPSEGLRPKIDGTACQIYLQVLESPDVMRVRERKAGGGMVRSKANYLQRTPRANHLQRTILTGVPVCGRFAGLAAGRAIELARGWRRADMNSRGFTSVICGVLRPPRAPE